MAGREGGGRVAQYDYACKSSSFIMYPYLQACLEEKSINKDDQIGRLYCLSVKGGMAAIREVTVIFFKI